LKAGVGWKSSDGEICAKERKGREVCESSKKKEGGETAGMGVKTPASGQGLRVNLERVAAAHFFPGCDSGELESNLHTCPRFLALSVRTKEAWKMQRDSPKFSLLFGKEPSKGGS
jgi:hypothetical protein